MLLRRAVAIVAVDEMNEANIPGVHHTRTVNSVLFIFFMKTESIN